MNGEDVLAFDNFKTEIHHLDGIPWYEAPAPSRFHRHVKQTWGWYNYFEYIERCACGATSYGRGWVLLDQPRVGKSTLGRVARRYRIVRPS